MQPKIWSGRIGLTLLLSLIVIGVSACGPDATQSSATSEKSEPVTFTQSVGEAMAEVPALKAEEAHQQLERDPNTLVVDVRDAADIAATGIIPKAVKVSLGSLIYKADHEIPETWGDPNFKEFSRPIITTCETGGLGALEGSYPEKSAVGLIFVSTRSSDGGIQDKLGIS